MKVNWRDNSYPPPILERFDPSRFTRGPKGVSYRTEGLFDIHNAASILLSFLDISGSSASSDEHLSAIVTSICESGASNKLNSPFFLSDLRRRLSQLETRPVCEYVVIGRISLSKSFRTITQRRINGVHIAIGADISQYSEYHSTIAARDRIFHGVPSSYLPITLKLGARSAPEALSRSDDALYLLLGCWNLAVTYRRPRYTFGGRHGPVAEIVLAPLRTLHKPSGESLNYWHYDPDFAIYPEAYSSSDNWVNIRDAEKAVRNKLATHNHQDFLENCIRGYYSACSCHMPHNAFLSLWTLLERLTGTDKGHVLIGRTLYPILQNCYDFCKWELRHLHHYRDCLVHRGDQRSDIELLVYQLKAYVDVVLQWWVFKAGRLVDKQEAFDLMDTPRDAKRIRRRIQILKQALKRPEMADPKEWHEDKR